MRYSDIGYVHSIQTLGTLDGPGVRFVVFLSGCNLRCSCCHNPDTWSQNGAKQYSARELAAMAARYREYFGTEGGVTLSGGEPLLQPAFAAEFFKECKEIGLNTCLDTSGSLKNGEICELLDLTDRVLLDIKYPTDELYRKHVGCSIKAPLEFLAYLNEKGIKTTLRQVVIPELTDTDQSAQYLRELKERYPCVDKIELLPFRKLCTVKYQALGIDFPFANLAEPDAERVRMLQNICES